MDIKTIDNQIFFYYKNSRAKIIYNELFIEIQLIYVEKCCRNRGLGKELLLKVLNYIEKSYKNIKKVILSPLPFDQNSTLKIDHLINFYSKYNFKFSNKPPMHSPYQMERTFNTK